MNYIIGTFPSPYYYFFIPRPAPFLMPPPADLSLPLPSNQNNAEIIHKMEDDSEKIIVTREDLLREGYEKNKKAWTQEEDALLLRLSRDENARFDDIAQKIPGRNAKMCYSRYRRLTHQSKNYWSRAQNTKLIQQVKKLGPDCWQEITHLFPNRNHKQLKEHYQNYLRPNLSKEKWTVEEDLQLIELFNTYGKDWRIIQNRMSNRSRNQIKNRYFGRILRLDAKKKSVGVKIETTIKEQAFAQSM